MGLFPFFIQISLLKEVQNMNSTALGAENTKKESIIFISEAHEKFYYEKLIDVKGSIDGNKE